MQMESLKQRLTDLKNASIQLKSKILQGSRIDSLNVSQILGNIPNYSNTHVSFPISQINPILDTSASRQGKPALNTLNQSLTYSPNNLVNISTANAARNQEHILWNSNSSSHQSSPSRQAIQQQIQKLRLQNDEIQSKILNISSQISNLKVLQTLRQQQSWKQNLPFINREGILGIFYTKLFIKQYDFDKIDYEKMKAELIYDHFTFFPPNRIQKTLKLQLISEVRYLENQRMRIQFKQEQSAFLYLEFSNHQQLQQWDLALVINHKIVNDKQFNKNLFAEEKTNRMTSIKSKSSLRIVSDSQQKSQFKNSEKESKRKGSVRFNDRKFQKIGNIERSDHSSSLKRSEVSNERNQLQYTLNGASLHPPQSDTINFHLSALSASSNRQKSLKDLLVFGEVGQSNQGSRANTSKFNGPDLNFQNIELEPTFTQQKPSLEIKPDFIKLQYDRALLELKDGYYFTKYAKNGFKPHNKKIFINSEQDMLIVANSEDLNNRKAIRIQNITALKYPAIGQGIRRHKKDANVQNFCVIEYQNQGKPQFIQLGCLKIVFIKRFSQQFRQFLRKKGLLIND